MQVLLIVATLVATASSQGVKTANYGVKGGRPGSSVQYHGGDNMVHYFGNYNNGSTYSYSAPALSDVGVCYIEVPTASLVRDPSHIPTGNGSQPNLSRIRSCCKGYIRNIHNHLLCDPVCSNECTNALCTAPETCTCFPEHVKNAAGLCVPTCPIGCQNGRCAGGECICNDGFRLDSDSKYCLPSCRHSCGPRGNCTAPETCSCEAGYQSSLEGCKPVCSQPCDGDCVAPNDCRCRHGHFKDERGLCHPQCTPSCGPNSKCISPNVCSSPSTTTSTTIAPGNYNPNRPSNPYNFNNPYGHDNNNYSSIYPGNQRPYPNQPSYPGSQTNPGYNNQPYPGPNSQSPGYNNQPYPGPNVSPIQKPYPNNPYGQPFNSTDISNPGNIPVYYQGPNQRPQGSNYGTTYYQSENQFQSHNITSDSQIRPDSDRPSQTYFPPGQGSTYNPQTNGPNPVAIPTQDLNGPSGYPSWYNQWNRTNHQQQNPGQNPGQIPDYPYPNVQPGEASLVPNCPQPCINGVCVEGNRCACNPGYIIDDIDPSRTRCRPHCPGGCTNGVCSAPNFCICNLGYRKEHGVKGRAQCVKRIR